MSDMKCPFCQRELRNCCAGVIYTCSKPDSCPHKQCYGSKELWKELIRTRKALNFGVDVLKEIDELLSSNKFDVKEVPLLSITQIKISMLLKCITKEQITALEQKDKR